jgi:site-specific DNA-cytosine methylase
MSGHCGLWKSCLVQQPLFSRFPPFYVLHTVLVLSRANHPAAIVYNQDTNMCLQNAIDAREGKLCEPLRSIADGKELPPMPQRGDVELITGGFPCQSFSGMNHQRHKSHEDIR